MKSFKYYRRNIVEEWRHVELGMLRYLGLANILFFLAVIIVCILYSSSVDLDLEPLSAFGSDLRVGELFNISLIIFAIGQTIFSLLVCTKLKAGNLTKALFVTGGLALLVAGVFPYGQYALIHRSFSIICALLVTPAVIYVMHKIKFQGVFHVIANISSVFALISLSLRYYLPGAWWQIFLLVGVVFWNILLTAPLLKLKHIAKS